MNLPFEMLWGVDVAIKKLRPNANFQLNGTQFAVWNDPTGSEPPSWEEVMAQLDADKSAAIEWELANK